MTPLAAIVLAAGRSWRMGDLKPLLPLGDTTVVERAVDTFLEVGIDDVRVVVGHRGDEVASLLAGLGVPTVVNRRWERGMFSSVATGVRSLSTGCESFFLLPADCALVRSETVGRLAREMRVSPAPVLYPDLSGRRGHPPLIARGAMPGRLDREPPGGVRAVLSRHDALAADVEVDDEGVLLDLDSPADYERACRYVADEAVPDRACCLSLLESERAPGAVVAHAHAVARVAVALAGRLNARGLYLNARLLEASALLHDVARTGPEHARAGARLLTGLGYRRVAAVTAHHMDLPADRGPLPGEVEILYLADKLVDGTHVVSLAERLARRVDDLRSEAEGQARARERLARAAELARRVEELVGESAEAIARRAVTDAGAAAAHG